MGGGSSGAGEARAARKAEEDRDKRIRTGTAQIRQQFAGTFDEPYYKQLEDTYKTKATGQANEQYADALQQMRYALMRSGNLNSTVAGRQTAKAGDPNHPELGGAYWNAMDQITDQARALSNQRRQDVVNAEGMAVNQLTASGDANAAAIQAANLINQNSKQPVAPPLGQLFTDLSAGLATQADLERANQNKYTVFGRIPGWSSSNRYSATVR